MTDSCRYGLYMSKELDVCTFSEYIWFVYMSKELYPAHERGDDHTHTRTHAHTCIPDSETINDIIISSVGSGQGIEVVWVVVKE